MRRAFGGYSTALASHGRPRLRRAVGRRRAAAGQARRRVLHAVLRRPVPRAAELGRRLRQRADAGPRAGPRLPQRAAHGTHRAAAPAPDGAGRDGEHLLRDARGGGGARGRDRRRRAPGPARRRPPGSRPGDRRHPQPLPVRDRGVLPAAPPDLERRRAVRADARRPSRGLRRRARPRHPPPLDVGGEAPLLLQPLLQLALHLRAAVRPRALRRATATMPTRSARATTSCSRPPAWPTPPRWARASGSTCATPAFWAASLDVLRGRIADYEALVAERTA